LPEVADETRINVRQFSQSLRPSPATFAMAQALVIKVVPWRMQKAHCLQNEPKLISFSALCISASTADMGIPVTTIKRVERTMEAKRFGPRRYRNDEQWTESRIGNDLPIPSRGPLGSRGTPLR
jgi:hypothetical protein